MTLSPNEPITDAKLLRVMVEQLQAAIDTGAGTDAIRPSVITAKGDIVVGQGAATPAVIPAGSNGQILSANSATSTGLEWIPAPTGGGSGGTAGVSAVNGRTGDVTLAKSDVGLSNVDNTSDAAKPVSTATQNALNLKANLSAFNAHVDNSSNPHLVTKAQVGLGNVDNTADIDKPVSLATQAALDSKASSFDVSAALLNKANVTDLQAKEDTANKGVAGGYAALNGSTRVVPAQLGQVPVVLTDAAIIATDASLSNQFRVTLAGNRTLGNPTNPFDGQLVMWSIKQDGAGSRTITLGSKFRFGTDITAVTLSTAPGKTDKLGAQYNAEDDKWDVVSFARGF